MSWRASSGSTFDFGCLFSTEDTSSHQHWGRIKCCCHHHTDEDADQARVSTLHHTNGSCLWTCCGANWSDLFCKAAVSSSGKIDDAEELKPPPKKKEANKFRRYLPTFYSQELVCLSCFKPYRNPMKLACGHSMCKECIEKVISYQKAAGSFSSRFRADPVKTSEEAAAASAGLKLSSVGNLRLRQMTRTQRRMFLQDGKKEAEEKDSDDNVIICPVCSESSHVSAAVDDVEIIEKMKELEEQRHSGMHPKCAFCTSAVLAGAQLEEASEATLVCAVCGPVCARHHALLHIAGPPTFRCHEVSETPMELLPLMNVIPHQYEICPKHGCEMDLYDKKTKSLLCEVCAAGLAKGDANARIIREEDKMAFLMEEADKAKERVALEKKSKEERLLEQEKQQKQQVASMQEELDASLKKCTGILEQSHKLFEEGKLTREVDGLAAARDDVRKLFAQSREALDEMEKQTLADMDKMVDGADEQLRSRFDASHELLAEAQDAASRVSTIPLDTPDIRAMLISRLGDILKSLKKVESLPVEPLSAKNLFNLEQKPEAIKQLAIAKISPVEGGLFASVSASSPPEGAASPSQEEQPPMEDEDSLLDSIRAKLKSEDTASRRSRDNGRYSSIKGSVNSGMSEFMKREAIAAILFDRGESVLGAPFEEIITVSEVFLNKNSVDHILEDLSSPADFNLEMRAIYAFLKQTKAL